MQSPPPVDYRQQAKERLGKFVSDWLDSWVMLGIKAGVLDLDKLRSGEQQVTFQVYGEGPVATVTENGKQIHP